jgi:glycosyltransferase involved in cell wall biosynthesis
MSDVPVLSLGRPDGRRPLVFSWGVSSYFGWGVYGLNLMLHLAGHPRFVPCCAANFGPPDVVLDPLREQRIAELARGCMPLWKALGETEGEWVKLDHVLLEGLGNDLTPSTAAHHKRLIGSPTIGVVFLEEAALSPGACQGAERFARIIAGSSWNEAVLRQHGLNAVTTVLQGVDTALYHPAPRTGLFPGRFVIFSGGKLEYRKGQDLVLAAFRAFHQRHPEALLVAAWHSHWSDFAARAVGHPGILPPRRNTDGVPDVVGWAVANGIPEDAIIAIPHIPNIIMPHVVREADAALFPNRCEGGTNLVAMECLASGIPSILSANTGHLDLLRHDIALPLERQGAPQSSHWDTTDWGESDVEEMVEKLEALWRDRSAAVALGVRAARFMAGMTWAKQLGLLIEAIEPCL